MWSTSEYTQSFVIRVWVEEPASESTPARWRGHITHIPSGERRYFDSLVDMTGFVIDYLQGGQEHGKPPPSRDPNSRAG